MQTKKYDKHNRLKSMVGLRCRFSTLDLRERNVYASFLNLTHPDNGVVFGVLDLTPRNGLLANLPYFMVILTLPLLLFQSLL